MFPKEWPRTKAPECLCSLSFPCLELGVCLFPGDEGLAGHAVLAPGWFRSRPGPPSLLRPPPACLSCGGCHAQGEAWGVEPGPACCSAWTTSCGPVSAQLCPSEECETFLEHATGLSRKREGKARPTSHPLPTATVPGTSPRRQVPRRTGLKPQRPGNPVIHGTVSTPPATQNGRTLTSGFQRSTLYINLK